MPKYTPAMQQYIDIKKDYKDCVLFFRMGDFYETFFEDAKICSKALDLVLTSKNRNSENPIPMAGIPYHSVEKYVTKLIQAGYKIAIAEQTTQPKPGQIVEREVVGIITPGTYIQEGNNNYNFMLAISFSNQKDGYNYHISWGDFSIGEYHSKSFDDLQNMQKFIFNLNPKEIILDIDFPSKDELENNIKNYMDCLISIYDKPFSVEEYILNQCKVQSLSSFGKALEGGRQDAFSILLHYIKNTQKSDLANIIRVSYHSSDNNVLLDSITQKNLEIFASNYENDEKYSLYGVINNTRTSGGARLLRNILSNPIKDISELNIRLDNIQYYQENAELSKNIYNHLANVLDTHKLVSTILYKKLSASSFVRLRANLGRFFVEGNESILAELSRLGLEQGDVSKCREIYDYLVSLLKDESDLDFTGTEGFIQDDFDDGVDELRKVAYHSDELLLDYQQELVNRFGMSNIKLKFVKNQGYFLEVTNKDIEELEGKVNSEKGIVRNNPPNPPYQGGDHLAKFSLIRRQTLKGQQRYVSEYLEEIQYKVLQAKDDLSRREFELLEEAKTKIGDYAESFNKFANIISWLDLYVSFSIFANNNSLIRPAIKKNKNLIIKEARHLVIERFLDDNQSFIPNDLKMQDGSGEGGELHIITGPNMGGKSTYLRQNALIVLMAHCGLFVPAKKVEIGLVDGIFARVGSGDVIAKNQSTFMTEMIEVANILNNATENSFIIFDELGRGTSTYDGLALTKAILEYVSVKLKAKTLIATHYHELIELEKYYENIKNFSVSVYETDKEVVFMKKIVPGGADKSYGVDVAKIAGIPAQILEQAWKYLQNMEEEKDGKPVIQASNLFASMPSRFEKTDPRLDKIKGILSSIDVNNITPVQALALLEKVKSMISDD